jgi:hypothetical protein
MDSAQKSGELTVSTSSLARINLQTRCQCVRSSRFFPMPVIYVHASPMVPQRAAVLGGQRAV